MCHSYTSGWINAWTIPDPPVPGLFEFLEQALRHFRVAVYSSRSEFERGREAMRAWFLGWAGKHYQEPGAKDIDGEVARAMRLIDQLEFPAHKPSAFVSLDDRCLLFQGIWPEMSTLRGFVPWNQHLKKRRVSDVATGTYSRE